VSRKAKSIAAILTLGRYIVEDIIDHMLTADVSFISLITISMAIANHHLLGPGFISSEMVGIP
jgi:hypothetical protein